MDTIHAVRTGLEGPGLTVAQKLWYCIATVGGQYIWARLQSFSAFRRWGDTEQVFFMSDLLSHTLPTCKTRRLFWIEASSNQFVLQRPLARRLWILIQRLEGIYRAASFGNLLIFLCTGRWFSWTTWQFTQHYLFLWVECFEYFFLKYKFLAFFWFCFVWMFFMFPLTKLSHVLLCTT